MKIPHTLKPQHKCLECSFHDDNYFCFLPQEQLRSFAAIKITTVYAKGSTLFIEGQPSAGVHMLCQGRVKLSTNSRNGKALILRIAEAGEVLGLSAALAHAQYGATAEAIEPCQVDFVQRADFIRFIRTNSEAGFRVIEQLNHKYQTAYGQIRSLGLSSCVADKLAALLLEWATHEQAVNGAVRMKVPFSHEEIGEMIGTSRETVTRLLKDFRLRQLINLKRSDLHILDTRLLEASIGTKRGPIQIEYRNGRANGNGHSE